MTSAVGVIDGGARATERHGHLFDPRHPPARRPRYRQAVDRRAGTLLLAATILGSAIVFIDQTVVNVALPAIRDDLDTSLRGQQWVVEGYLLTLASLVLVGGSLGDVLGRRRVFTVGVAAFGVTSIVCALAPSSGVLIAARALQGVAGALLVPSSLAILTAAYHDPRRRASAIGAWTAATSAAVAAGPPLGGLLVDTLSWRAIFLVNVPLCAVGVGLIAKAVPAFPPLPGRRIDVPGATLSLVGLGGVVFALIEQQQRGFSDPLILTSLTAGALALLAFVVYEHARARDPMLPLGLFASRNFAVGNLSTLTVYAGLASATFFVAVFLQQVAGYSALEGGPALLPVTLMTPLLPRRFGALAGRHGPRRFMGLGPIVSAVGLLLYLRLDEHTRWVIDVLPAALVFGLGLAMTVAPLTAAVLGAVDPARAGIASGVNNAVARVAGLLAIAAVGAIVAARFAAQADDSTATPLAPAGDALHT